MTIVKAIGTSGERRPALRPRRVRHLANGLPGVLAAFLASVLILGLGAKAEAGPTTQGKRLIEFGWDEPDTSFLRRHIKEMEKTPFDGCVFHVSYLKSNGHPGNFAWECWGKRAFSFNELKPAVDDLNATHFHRFEHNFLRFDTVPGNVDWFDDFSAILNNARLAARIARYGRCDGLLFDIEQYASPLFDYRRQRDAATKSWELYATQARLRGRQVMAAFQRGFPNLTVLLTFGYSLPWAETEGGKKSLADCHYGLLAPFLDGMLEAASGRTRLVDGYELSYGYKERAAFEKAAKTMRTGLLSIVNDPDRYTHYFQVGFGVWMDKDWRRHGWHEKDFSKNYFSPRAFEKAVHWALETSDRYVWIYTETPRWWSDSGQPVKLPPAYAAALRRARNLRPAYESK